MQIKLTEEIPIDLYYENIDKVAPEDFTQIRRAGFGGSDASVLVGVSPFSTVPELIASKVRTEVTAEEAAIGQLRNVRAGNDLEPIVIQKVAKTFPDWHVFKPSHMYRFKDFPWLTMNFDGVGCGDVGLGYFPVEIKFVSTRGSFAYDTTKAIWQESSGFQNTPGDVTGQNMPITAKAANYGLPPYYYTQLVQEIAALNAPIGYLAALFEKDWNIAVFQIPTDMDTFSQIVLNGERAWQEVLKQKAIADAATSSGSYVEPDDGEAQY